MCTGEKKNKENNGYSVLILTTDLLLASNYLLQYCRQRDTGTLSPISDLVNLKVMKNSFSISLSSVRNARR